jgi:hypothetical protein
MSVNTEDSNLTTRTISTIVNYYSQEVPKPKIVYYNGVRYVL